MLITLTPPDQAFRDSFFSPNSLTSFPHRGRETQELPKSPRFLPSFTEGLPHGRGRGGRGAEGVRPKKLPSKALPSREGWGGGGVPVVGTSISN